MVYQSISEPLKDVDAFRRISDGSFEFHRNLVISSKSRFGDSLWSWYDPLDERQRSYESYRLEIDWLTLKENYKLTDSIILDLKRFAFLRLVQPGVFGVRRRIRSPHPVTIVNEISTVAVFFCHLLQQTSGEGFNLVNELSDIEVEDLENALTTYNGRQHSRLKQTLTFLSNQAMSVLLSGGPLKWNKQDLDYLQWSFSDREPYERVDDKLFRFLSNVASADVKQFLVAMNIPPEDATALGAATNIFLSAFDGFRDFFEEYLKNLDEYGRRRLQSKDHVYVMWCRTKGSGSVLRMNKLIDRARKAAQMIIAMYSGARLSELNSFRCGCVYRKGDQWVLKGTEIKRRGRWGPVLEDEWLAIPVVRDAVKVLEQTSRLVRTEYLFHGRVPSRSKHHRGASSNTCKKWFKNYLNYVDEAQEWSDRDLHAHRFRHTLVFQLRKAGLGLPFITFQLKHFYDALHDRLTDATLMYGNLGGNAVRQAVEDANRIFVEQVYHPDSSIAGAGAEAHRARRAAFFRGMALQGVSVEEALTRLARKGMPLTDVGIALCSGQRKIVLDGIKKDPPCIGVLRCNPVRCPNGIIPAHKLPAWERLAFENRRRAKDPELAHARAYYEEAAGEAEGVIRLFQIQR